MRVLESEGFKVTYLPVGTNGLINLKVIFISSRVRSEEPCLGTGIGVDTRHKYLFDHDGEQRNWCSSANARNRWERLSVSLVVKTFIYPGKICRSKKVFFHTDAAQAVGKVPIDVNQMNIDLMSISGHKIYGPKGVGALFVRRRPRVRLDPIQTGGGQERNVRSGTVPTPLVVGLGAACEIAQQEMAVSNHGKARWMRKSRSMRLFSTMRNVPVH